MKCPCCGGEFKPTDASVDLSTNVFVCATGTVKLTMQQAELAYALLEASPRVVTYDVICQRLWGCKEPETPHTVIKTQTNRLRKAIEPHGYAIQATREVGLRLINLNELPAYAA
jgi:DNA-binding response OmpR family regulator